MTEGDTDLAQLREALRYVEERWTERHVLNVLDAARELLTIREAGALIITPDEDGDAPDWFYEAASDRLEKVGGRPKGDPQWEDKSYRMAYAAVVWRALRDAMPDGET